MHDGQLSDEPVKHGPSLLRYSLFSILQASVFLAAAAALTLFYVSYRSADFGQTFIRAGLLLTAEPAGADGDIQSGKVKSYTCTGCHSIPGYNNVYPTYKVPKIGGQNYQYLVVALKAYRAGERDHATMELQATALSDQDIEDIAAYFASLGKD